MDSAATHHITNDLANLHLYHPYQGSDQVMVGNGAAVPIQHSGKGILPTSSHSFQLSQVYHVPSLTNNLVSVQKFTQDSNCTVTFDDSTFLIQDKDTKRILSKGHNLNGLYQFSPSTISSSFPPQAHVTTSMSATTWHSRLGHPSPLKFSQLAQQLKLFSDNKCTSLNCTHCAVAKSHRLPFTLSNSTVNKPLSLIHSDVWGPFHLSTAGFSYYVLFIDDFSRFTWVYPLTHKHEVFSKFVAFKAYAETQFNTKLQVFRTDGGGEYTSTPFSDYLTHHGIVHQLSCPHTSSQNRVAERKHRHLVETAIALLHQSSLPLKYWFDALATSVFLINRMPSKLG